MKYKCTICGYVYDEAQEGVPFADLPEDWQCPLCGAPKGAFEPIGEAAPDKVVVTPPVGEQPVADDIVDNDDMQRLSIGEMAALCSNLARGCEKQYMAREALLFRELAEWFTRHTQRVDDATVEALAEQLQKDMTDYPHVNASCVEQGDRGAQRALTWSEKATRMLKSLVERYQREGDALLVGNEIWVCSVCGFVYIGKAAPVQCPVCKVPSWQFNKIERRKQS